MFSRVCGSEREAANIRRPFLVVERFVVTIVSGSTRVALVARGDPPRFKRGAMSRRRVSVGRVYDERRRGDGVRVLVDRLWPRGLSRERADLDEWCKDVAPSPELRRWYAHDSERFAEFRRRYRAELREPARAEALDHLRALAKRRNLTLLTATKSPEISEAAVLHDLLDSR